MGDGALCTAPHSGERSLDPTADLAQPRTDLSQHPRCPPGAGRRGHRRASHPAATGRGPGRTLRQPAALRSRPPSSHRPHGRRLEEARETDSIFRGRAPTGDNRVNRGGSFDNTADRTRAANRNRNNPDNANDNQGFRVVLPEPEVMPSTNASHPKQALSRRRPWCRSMEPVFTRRPLAERPDRPPPASHP
jgi:hypothetical protein